MKSKLYSDKVDYDKLNQFIVNVWNHYAGKINIVVPANLEVKYVCDPTSHKAGVTFYPCNVKIYPNIIIDLNDGDMGLVYEEIIEVIIHELFHVDQFKINSEACNPSYVKIIESQVEFMTNTYILTNLRDIYDTFGIIMNEKYYKNELQKYSNQFYMYNRVTPLDHIILGIDAMTINNNMAYPYMEHMIDVVNDTNKDIIYKINGYDINIRKNGYIISLFDYNKIINEIWFKYDLLRYDSDNFISSEETDDYYIITINAEEKYNDLARVISL